MAHLRWARDLRWLPPDEITEWANSTGHPRSTWSGSAPRCPRYDELQEQAIAAIPFPPERVLELGMGTGETTRRLIEAYPDAWVVGLDSSPDMVFRARETYDDVQLARMEDPLPDGPWDLVISVLSVNQLDDEQKRKPLPPGQGAVPLAGHRRRLRRRARPQLEQRTCCEPGAGRRGRPGSSRRPGGRSAAAY